MRRLSIAASARPTPRPAANAAHGDPKRTISAATSPFSPSSAPESTVNGADGAAAHRRERRQAADEPERERDERLDRAARRSARASGSDEIACSARPWRVRSSVHAASAASAAASPITKNDRTWTLAPAIVTTPFRPTLVERGTDRGRRTPGG